MRKVLRYGLPRCARNDTLGWIAALTLTLLLQACSKAPEPVAQVAPLAPAAAKTIAWVKPDGANIEPIFAQARAANKPVFLYWGAVWCPPCNQIKATVFNRPDFIERSASFVPVYLDGDTPGAQKLGAQFKVRGYPTMILFRPDGSELTRLPGEVDALKYLEVLNLGLATGSSVKESLAAALSADGAKLTPENWRALAYYAWEQDEAQLVAQTARAATLHKLARACPETQREAATRLALKAMVASALDKAPLPDPAAAASRVQQILGDAAQTRENFDVIINYGAELAGALSRPGSAERSNMLVQWNAALDRLAADASLSLGDRLGAVSAKLALVKLGQPKGAKPKLDAALLAQVRESVAATDKAAVDRYERQAVIPNAADLLSEAGLLDESDALLKAELPKAVSPYYHMLVLAANAKARGDKAGSLDWAEQAWKASQGPATRLQWGSSYVNRLLELAPGDVQRIEQAATGVLAELDATPETFYERNRRGLEKMGQRLLVWQTKGGSAPVVKRLAAQLDALCARLPVQDEARGACSAVFQARPGAAKT